jgi:hypothetical protein
VAEGILASDVATTTVAAAAASGAFVVVAAFCVVGIYLVARKRKTRTKMLRAASSRVFAENSHEDYPATEEQQHQQGAVQDKAPDALVEHLFSVADAEDPTAAHFDAAEEKCTAQEPPTPGPVPMDISPTALLDELQS